jgi:hypothetical protein
MSGWNGRSATVVVFGLALTGICRSAASRAEAEIRPKDTASLSGKWTRAADIEQALGYERDEQVPDIVEFQIDAQKWKSWGDWDKEDRAAVEAQWARRGHEIAATGGFGLSTLKGHLWWATVTHRMGSTYATFYLPQVGGVTNRIVHIDGTTRDRDLLFIEWSVTSPYGVGEGRKSPRVSAFRRYQPERDVSPPDRGRDSGTGS